MEPSDNEPQCYGVKYPSGTEFDVRGRFVLAPLGQLLVPVVLQDGNKAVLLDQRAIVSLRGAVVYSPRRNRDGLDPTISAWIDDNDEWAN